ncbi:hypothetical protein RRF57_007046 [Xylaria bambusicola]|uniref:C2H2-type domain-containing protein n=1 Tax=Xylaria bambusicola TaxID=326684 RepID=A0AAN7UM61_9PEZI
MNISGTRTLSIPHYRQELRRYWKRAMSQSNTTPVHLPAAMGPPSEPMALTKRFECEVPGCGKVFRRKEHLTRHSKSHDTQLQYACHICGRRYARSDVLKRHVEFHPQYYKPKREFIACTRCRESKTKCDEEHPCKPCSRRELECVRPERSRIIVSSENVASELPLELSNPPPNQAQVLHVSTVGEPENMRKRLDIYFNKIHPNWPILQPCMTISDGSGPLVTSIMALVSWLEGDQDHLLLFHQALDEIERINWGRNPPVPVLQAIVLCLLYAIHCLTTEGMVLKAWRIHNDLVSACRLAGILIPQRGIWYASNEVSAEMEEYKQQSYRIAFAALRLDAYLAAMTDLPPLIRYQELSMSLCHATWWANVTSEEERRQLQENEPMLRKKTSFGFRVHDLFGPSRPNVLAPSWTKIDYHFILCAIQSGAWEASHQALRTIPDDIQSRTHPQDLRTTWREYLNTWATNLENDCQGLREDDIDPQTLLLWHMTTLKIHAPPGLWGLQQRYYNFDAPPETPLQPALRTWQASKIARTAVWHSAQIARIVSGELSVENVTTRIRLNPLLTPALLMSAFVVCGYAYHARTCPLCTGGGPIDLVNIFGAPDDCKRLDRWLEEGEGLANWGPDIFVGFPVCQCSQILLYDWFHKFLAQDTQADAALRLFLDELKAGTW